MKKNLKDVAKKLSELVNEFSKVAEYKVSAQNPVVLPHANGKWIKLKLLSVYPGTTRTKHKGKEMELARIFLDMTPKTQEAEA